MPDSGSFKIRAVNVSSGAVSTFAGGSTFGSTNGVGTSARFGQSGWPSPWGVFVAPGGLLYIADQSNALIRVANISSAAVSAYAGVLNANALQDGPASAAKLFNPASLALNPATGILTWTESNNNLVRSMRALPPSLADGYVSVVAGGSTGNAAGFQDGYGRAALFAQNALGQVSLDAGGNVWLADAGNSKIRVLAPNGFVSTLLTPSFVNPSTAGGWQGYADGSAATALFNSPRGIVVASGSAYGPGLVVAYVADTGNNAIRRLTCDASTPTPTPSIASSVTATPSFSPTGSITATGTPTTTVSPGAAGCFVTLLAGSTTAAAGALDGTGTAVLFNRTAGVAVNPLLPGVLLVLDRNRVRTTNITSSSAVVATLAGSGAAGNSDGLGNQASFSAPWGVAYNASGFAIISDGSALIRSVDPLGNVARVAGNGSAGWADGAASSSQFNGPSGVAIDIASGNIFIADVVNEVIRSINASTGLVATFAGSVGVSGWVDGALSSSLFSAPFGLALDQVLLTLYVSDGFVIRAITISSGLVTTIAGSGYSAYTDSNGGMALESFLAPRGLALDTANSRLLVADGNVIRAVALDGSGTVSTVAGSGAAGLVNSWAPLSSFSSPAALAVLPSGVIVVSDSGSNELRRVVCVVTPTPTLSTSPTATVSAGFSYSGSSSVSPTKTRTVTTSATPSITPTLSLSPSGTPSSGATTSVTPTQTSSPSNSTTPSPSITRSTGLSTACTLASFVGGGSGSPGSADGTSATFSSPTSFAINATASGDALVVVDASNHRVRVVSAKRVTSTLAGSGAPTWQDGVGVLASFYAPQDAAFLPSGNVLVADAMNHVLRVVTPVGVVSTLCGVPSVAGWVDGAAASAQFHQPYGLAVGPSGVAYVTDRITSLVRVVAPGGAVSTLAGSGSPSYADGVGTLASFWFPQGIALAADGMLFVAGA